MYAFTVKTMTCGGCSAAITRAILAADKSATVNATPANRRVEVETRLSHDDLLELLDDAGFPAELA
ncbi:MAG TPA: heavy-metal-associated domain-containing protein [Cellvibrio sp.]|nr:heavy-metal-associated domain-containing protein [Cellvibrio sp.]